MAITLEVLSFPNSYLLLDGKPENLCMFFEPSICVLVLSIEVYYIEKQTCENTLNPKVLS